MWTLQNEFTSLNKQKFIFLSLRDLLSSPPLTHILKGSIPVHVLLLFSKNDNLFFFYLRKKGFSFWNTTKGIKVSLTVKRKHTHNQTK